MNFQSVRQFTHGPRQRALGIFEKTERYLRGNRHWRGGTKCRRVFRNCIWWAMLSLRHRCGNTAKNSTQFHVAEGRASARGIEERRVTPGRKRQGCCPWRIKSEYDNLASLMPTRSCRVTITD